MIKKNNEFLSQKHIIKCYPLLFLIIFLSIPGALLFIIKVGIEWVAITIALEVGIGSIMQPQISRKFFPPIFDFSVKEVITDTNNGTKQKWYNLCIKNHGFDSARNLRVKIRDAEEKSWIKLTLPFAKLLEDQGKDSTCIKNLSVREDNDFNIGYIGENDKFNLTLNIYPNNQKRVLEMGEETNYFLEIIADNVNPNCLKMKIKNNGYKGSVSFSLNRF